MFIPILTDLTSNGPVQIDVVSRLLRDRIILCFGQVNTQLAASITSQLFYLQADNPEKPIRMYVQGPGGELNAGDSIVDAMQFISCPVHTIGMGVCASMDSIILMAGDKRLIMPHTEVMIHQPLMGTEGQITDIEIAAKNAVKIKNMEIDRISRYTGQPKEKVAADVERDYWLSAQEALEYGIVDEIISGRKRKL